MLNGLSSLEVKEKKRLGLSNQSIDSYNASYPKIFFRNIFNLVNIVLFPLLLILGSFGLYTEILAFSTFLTINTLVSIADEVRAKRKLDKLKNQFQQTARVIRDSKEIEIPVSEVVEGDFVLAKEGEGIIADGKIYQENYLQVDESMLTGESNYLEKDANDKVMSGSFVVTGNCIYIVESVGQNNYLNKLGKEALKYKRAKSSLQQSGNKIISFLVFAALALSVANFLRTSETGVVITDRILSLTSLIALIIPQTLIFLFTLTFTISITKLFSKGILIQKGGSIEELSNVDTICFDKTGTLTTNKMRIVDLRVFNMDLNEFGGFYNSVRESIVSVNETQKLINKYFEHYPKAKVEKFFQIPFTSKLKYSLVSGKHSTDGKSHAILFGAFGVIKTFLTNECINDVTSFIQREEEKGNRVLTGIFFENVNLDNLEKNHSDLNKVLHTSGKAIVFSIEEELNPGIGKLLKDLGEQNIKLKIISGDSLLSVSRIAQKIDLPTEKIIDLHEFYVKSNAQSLEEDFKEMVDKYTIFTRARPDDKLKIIDALRAKGHKVAMVGDGINDVLGLKAADVSIAMESGSKITREVADIVLLGNDYNKIPQIFFEGENIIYNLKLSTKMFLAKTIMAIFLGIYFTLVGAAVPLHPSAILIFSFLGSSAPSYVIVFTRQNIKRAGKNFFKETLYSSIVTGFIFAAFTTLLFYQFRSDGFTSKEIGTSLVLFLLSSSIFYSLYLVWESKKLRNILLAGFVYVFLQTVGVFQTLLPLMQDKYSTFDKLVLLGIMIFGGLLFGFVLRLTLKPKKRIFRILTVLFGLVPIPIASIFPMQTYYNVTNISSQMYFVFIPLSILVLIFIIITHVAGSFFFNRYSK